MTRGHRGRARVTGSKVEGGLLVQVSRGAEFAEFGSFVRSRSSGKVKRAQRSLPRSKGQSAATKSIFFFFFDSQLDSS